MDSTLKREDFESDIKAIDIFKWVFQKQNHQDLHIKNAFIPEYKVGFARALGQFVELARKFLIENKLELVNTLFKKYLKNYINHNVFVKHLKDHNLLNQNMSNIQDPVD